MYSDSRKAQRNSFAHHRAHLLFKRPEAKASDVLVWKSANAESATPAETLVGLTRQVRAGLLGFVPAGVSAVA